MSHWASQSPDEIAADFDHNPHPGGIDLTPVKVLATSAAVANDQCWWTKR